MNRRGFAIAWIAAALLCAGVFGQEIEDSFAGTPPPVIRLDTAGEAEEALQDPAPAALAAPLSESAAASPAAPLAEAPPPELTELQRLYDESPASPEDETAQAAAGTGMVRATLVTFFWLCVLCAVIILGGYAVRRYGRKTPLLAGQRLGNVLGRVYLNPKMSIHYVKTGGRVLLLGVTPQQVTLLTDFDATAFEEVIEEGPVSPETLQPEGAASFLAELQANNRRLQAPDDELLTLRSDIQRLQQSLQEKTREHR